MKKMCSAILSLSLASSFAFGGQSERCYELSASPTMWSRTPELLCIKDKQNGPATIQLKTGMRGQVVGQFSFSLLQRVRSITENQDVYGIENPSNSVFNKLQIRFDGTHPLVGGDARAPERGKLWIGATEFSYRAKLVLD